MICDNCRADVPKTYESSDGRHYCCAGCIFHPLGCRCKFGEFGVVQDKDIDVSGEDNYDEDNYDEDNYDEDNYCDNCNGIGCEECNDNYWLGECGKMPSGLCLKAGSEECDFECPFRDK